MSPPDRLLAGRFQITGAPLGEGEAGILYPGEDRSTGREVTLKVLHAHLARDPEALERLQGEVALAGRLKHPRIVTVHGLWADDGRWFLVTDRARGVPLDALDGGLAPESVISLGLQLCEALEAAHARGVVHGDLRPEKIILGPDGARILGFRTGEVRIRPGLTAPEIQEGAPPGPAADLYGLGVVLHRAMTGQAPWSGPTPFALLAAQREGIEAVHGPRGLAQLIRALLQPDPARRPADPAAVATALRRLRRNPQRQMRIPTRWVPPIRPGHAWAVVGVDPETGARSMVRMDLSRKGAARMAAHLRAEGWEVRRVQEALGWGDLLWLAALTLLFGVGLPIAGAPLGFALGVAWRARGLQPRLREVLPAVRAPLPPRPLPAGTEHAVVAGGLLLAAAALLWFYPYAAILPLALAAMVLGWSRVQGQADVGRVALQARIVTRIAEARAALDAWQHPMDRALGLQGELDVLEQQWVEGELADREVLGRVEALQRQAEQARWAERSAASQTLDALRRGGSGGGP